MKLFWILCVILVMSGCNTLSQADVGATMTVSSDMLATQAAMVNSTALARRTEVISTVAVNEAQLANLQNINAQLAATLVSSASPTPGLRVGSAPLPDDQSTGDMMMSDNSDSSTVIDRGSFQITGVTDRVDDDGCVAGQTNTFSSSTPQLYVTMTAFDLPESSFLRVEWYWEGELRIFDSWMTPRYFDGACLWFILDQNRTSFTPGQWTVRLYYNDRQIGTGTTFNITD